MGRTDTHNVVCLKGSAISYFIAKLLGEKNKILVISPEEEVEELYLEIKTFAKNVGLIIEGMNLQDRIKTIELVGQSEKFALIATYKGISEGIGSVDELIEKSLIVRKGDELKREEFVEKLVEIGYMREDIVDRPGTIAVRGFVIDLFPVNFEYPVRIELDEDKIESIRFFEPDSQRSLKETGIVTIYPVRFERKDSILQIKFDEIIKIDPLSLAEELETISFFSEKEIPNLETTITIEPLPEKESSSEKIIFNPFSDLTGEGKLSLRLSRIKNLTREGYTAFIVCREEEVGALEEILKSYDTYARKVEFKRGLPRKSIYILTGFIRESFLWENERVVIVRFEDLIGKGKKSRKSTKSKKLISQLPELEVGDYVVHREHGIGIFQGIRKLEIEGNIFETIAIEYADGDILYVPIDKLDLVEKYISKEGAKPPLDKLGSKSWETRRRKVRKAVEEIAEKLIMIEAKRKALKGYSFSPDTPWQLEFENAFPFEETPDQLKAIEDVKRDMESPRPMDRLICGDVGFGKTEVAMRAAFKAVMDGKQVAVLTPTTLLAHQHYETFTERFKDFPVRIEVLTRFVPKKEQKRIVEDTKAGNTDILIGTHRVLMEDVEFKDLGLLIIDEEHKFGVEHKEKIKEKYPTIDILTLSATPIPRTLNMALSGIKDISIIETPPEGRQNVKTFVMFYNEDIIKRAIERELSRGGRVFVVKSRIEGLVKLKENLERLIPEAKYGIVHGKMKSTEIEEVMLKFTTGEIDVLVATPIIESGLDIPKANTLIVVDSEKFGLSQLYQLRGRVGRGRETAYAYFLVTPKKVTEEVKKRLKALEEFSELGSGLRLALRDMEIRGFGNILGKEQSGHIVSVGLEEYLRLLEEAVRKLKGEEIEEFEPTIKINIPAYIPDDYVGNERMKIRLYRNMVRLNLEELENLKQELEDRFGRLPIEVKNLMDILKLRLLAKYLRINKILDKGNKIHISTDRADLIKLLVSKGFKVSGKDTVYTEKDLGRIVTILEEVREKSDEKLRDSKVQ